MMIEQLEILRWAVLNKDTLAPHEKAQIAKIIDEVIYERTSMNKAFNEIREGMNH